MLWGLIVPKDGKCRSRERHWIFNQKITPNPNRVVFANRYRKMDSKTGKKMWTAFEGMERRVKAETSFERPLTFLYRNDCCADVPSQLLLVNVPFENTIHNGMCDVNFRESETASSSTSAAGIILRVEKLEHRRSKQYQKSRFKGQAHVLAVFGTFEVLDTAVRSTVTPSLFKRPRPSCRAGGCFNEHSQHLGAWVISGHTHSAQDGAGPRVTRRKSRSI